MKNLKNIPPINELLKSKKAQNLIEEFNREYVLNIAREITEQFRKEVRRDGREVKRQDASKIILDRLEAIARLQNQGSLKKVINGTGVVLHTNLGRAPLSKKALKHVTTMAEHYNNLEMNLETGERGSRYEHVESLFIRLTNAEAALVVNNNAAAVLLALTTLASGREVIVSRGQLIEIGGSFRIPEVMKLSGAALVEVGTTNRTYLNDYASAINEYTALLFNAHTSNYKVIGFVHEVALSELVELGKRSGIPVMLDLGSGILHKAGFNLQEEPTVQECVASGADIISFSGDKLLGGPQAGILLGKKEYIEAMKKNQLLRALRVDKLTLAALEGTLLEYLTGKPEINLPVINMLTQSPAQLKKKAEKLLVTLQAGLAGSKLIETIELCEVEDMVGGGAYPTYKLPGYGIRLEFTGISLEAVAKKLRQQDPAVIIRRQENQLIISVRTLFEEENEQLGTLLANALI